MIKSILNKLRNFIKSHIILTSIITLIMFILDIAGFWLKGPVYLAAVILTVLLTLLISSIILSPEIIPISIISLLLLSAFALFNSTQMNMLIFVFGYDIIITKTFYEPLREKRKRIIKRGITKYNKNHIFSTEMVFDNEFYDFHSKTISNMLRIFIYCCAVLPSVLYDVLLNLYKYLEGLFSNSEKLPKDVNIKNIFYSVEAENSLFETIKNNPLFSMCKMEFCSKAFVICCGLSILITILYYDFRYVLGYFQNKKKFPLPEQFTNYVKEANKKSLLKENDFIYIKASDEIV